MPGLPGLLATHAVKSSLSVRALSKVKEIEEKKVMLVMYPIGVLSHARGNLRA